MMLVQLVAQARPVSHALLLAPAGRLRQAESGGAEVADVVTIAVAVVIAVVLAFAVAEVVAAVTRAAGRRSRTAVTLARRARRPLRAVLLVVGVWIALRLATSPAPWVVVTEHLLLIALIIVTAWLIGSLAFVVEDATLAHFRSDVPDNRHARRIRTQITVLRRVTVAVLAVCAAAGVLMTFPEARAAGATVLASAGVISIVAGLAAQSLLGNFLAGIQLAFTDAIRVDDVVVVDGEWGRIEEITMTYVVVHIWDDRRLILPSTHFTTLPFENWTRRASELLGTVELDLDWNVPVEAMRTELRRLLSVTDLWDGRVGILQVTDTTNGVVRMRALASAADAPTLFDLRCYLREGLVRWLQSEMPSALPRTRLETHDLAGALPAGVPGVAEHETALSPVPETPVPVTPVPGRAALDDAFPGDVAADQSASDARAVTGAVPVPDDSSATAVLPATGALPATDETGASGDEPTVRRRSVRHTTETGSGADDTQRIDLASSTDSRLFTGSIDAIERSKAFTGPGHDAYVEREEAADDADERPTTGGARPATPTGE